jgi:hypothetical protein
MFIDERMFSVFLEVKNTFCIFGVRSSQFQKKDFARKALGSPSGIA